MIVKAHKNFHHGEFVFKTKQSSSVCCECGGSTPHHSPWPNYELSHKSPGGGEGQIYTLTFCVLRQMTNKAAYPILLSQDQQRGANGSKRWSITKALLAFGLLDNRSFVTIGFGNYHLESSVVEEFKPKSEPDVHDARFLCLILTTRKESH